MNKIQLSIALILLAIAAAAIGAVVIRDDDMDDDGIPNKWEWTHASYSWLDASDAGRDDDADHLATAAEFHAGLDPLNPDSDGDSFRDDLDLRPHDDAQLAFDTAIPPGLMRGEREFSVIGYTSDAVVRKYWDQSEVPASNLDRATYEYHPTPETAWELHQPSLSPGLRFAEAPRETARGPLPPEVVEDCDPLFQTDKHAKCAKITYSPYRVDYVARITNDRERAWYTPSGPHVVAVTQVDIPLGSDSIPVIFQGSYPNDQPLALNVRAFPSRSFLGVEPSIDRTVMATPIEGNVFRVDLTIPASFTPVILVVQPLEVEGEWSRPANGSALRLAIPTIVHELGSIVTLKREHDGATVSLSFGGATISAARENATRSLQREQAGDAADIATWTQHVEAIQIAAESGLIPNPGVDLDLYTRATKRGSVAGATFTIVQPGDGDRYHVTKVTGALTHGRSGVMFSTQTTTTANAPPTKQLREIYEKGSTSRVAERVAVIAEMGDDGNDIVHAVARTSSADGWKEARDVAAKSIAAKGARHTARLIPAGAILYTATDAAQHWADAQAAATPEARQAALESMERSIEEGLVSSTFVGEVALLAWDLGDPIRRHFFTPGVYALTDDPWQWFKFWKDERIPEPYADYAHDAARSRIESKNPGIPLASWDPASTREIETEDEARYRPTPGLRLLPSLSVFLVAALAARRCTERPRR